MYTLQLTCIQESKDGNVALNIRGVLPMTSLRAVALVWILKSETYKFQEFVMTGHGDFCQHLGSDNFQAFLELKAFLPLQQISIDRCELDRFPKFDHFNSIDTIDVSHNNLKTLPTFSLKCLRQLRLEGNPIQEVELGPMNFPNLELLSLGSTQTEIIGGKLLERAAYNTKFSLEVDHKYRDYLIVPLLIGKYSRPLNFGGLDFSIAPSSDQSDTSVSVFSRRRLSLPGTLPRSNSKKAKSEVTGPVRVSSRPRQRRMSLFAKSEKTSKPSVRISGTRDRIEKTLDVSHYHAKVKREMDFRSIEKVKSRFRATVYVLENVNCSNYQHGLTLTTQSDLFEFLGLEGFNDFLKHDGLAHLNYLYLGDCNLPKIPDLRHLTELRYLDLSGNQMKDFDEGITKLIHLHHLDISRNPVENISENITNCSALESLNIEETHIAVLNIDFSGGKLRKLTSLQCGSEFLKCISHATLKRKLIKERELKIEVLEEYRPTLILPNYETLVSRSLLHEFLGKQSLTDILNNDLNQNEYYEALMNLLNQGDQQFTTIDLTGQDVGNERLQVILDNKNSVSLTRLGLRRSNLTVLPDLTNLENLTHLDISNNSITTLKDLESKTLTTLVAIGNSFPVLDFNPDKAPSLTEVSFGSEKCNYVSIQILQKCPTRPLKLKVSDEGRQHLMIPPPDILESVDLETYVQTTEINLGQFNTKDPKEQLECMSWLIENKKVGYDWLSLAGEATFCRSVGIPELESVLNKLTSLGKIDLSDCKLETIPDIRCLTKLEVLNFKGNKVENFAIAENSTVREIDFQDNPVVGFDIKRGSLPSLNCLKIGSSQTKYLSLGLLSEVKEETLEVIVAKQYLDSLIFPSADCMVNRKCLEEFVDKASLDLTSVSGEERKNVLQWVLQNCDGMLKSLKILSQDEIYSQYNRDMITIFQNEMSTLQQLGYLSMNGLGLTSIPDLSFLENLIVADFNNNQIKTIDDKVVNESLREINLSMNPIVAFNTDLTNFPSLVKLQMGSPETKYMCYPLLERMSSRLEVSIHESCRSSLVYPTYDVANRKESLRDFIEKKELNLRNVDVCEKSDAFNWLMKKCGVNFRSLRLSGEENLLNEIGVNLSDYFETVDGFRDLREIYLDSCGLDWVPRMSSLEKLEDLNLEENKIQDLDSEMFPASIRKISVKCNNIQCINLDCSKFPNLKEIVCGSERTRYITCPLISKIHSTNFKITIPENFAQYLFMPPAIVLKDREHLSSYVKHPEGYLAKVAIEYRSDALQWLFSSSKPEFLCLDFSMQKWFFQPENDVDFSCISLQNVSSLTLSDCSLRTWPEFVGLSKLKCLNLSDNRLDNISPGIEMSALESLNIANNPIEEIDFNVDVFPKLKDLIMGSSGTRFISVRVLNQTLDGNRLVLNIPEELHRQNLLLPSWNTITEGRDSIRRYVSSKTLGPSVSHILDHESRLTALLWQLDKNEKEKTFTILDFSNQGDFCRNISFSTIFEHDSMQHVTEVNLSDCDLEAIPDWSNLSSLTKADLSGNDLTEVPSSKTLECLDFTGCKMKVLSFPAGQFPKLQEVRAGSDDLEYIAFGMMERVSVGDSYQKSLVMPPPCVFSEGKIDEYINAPEKFLCKVDREKLGKASEWLFNEADKQFTELDLSRQGDVLKLSDVETPHIILQSKNVSNVTLLNVSSCQLDNSVVLELTHLGKLKTLLISDNNLTDLSTLQQPTLTSIDVTGNPLPTVNVDFELCPELVKMNMGSNTTKCLSVDLLNRIGKGNLVVGVDDKYKANIMFPPPRIVKNNFTRDQVDDYLNSGVFDLSWYESLKSRDDLVAKLSDIIAMDKRNIHTVKLCDQPALAKAIGSKLDDLLLSPNLTNIENMFLRNCDMRHVPSFQHLSKLARINLSGNQVDIDRFQEIIDDYENSQVTHLSLCNTNLNRIPVFSNLKHLTDLEISGNSISSLQNLENPSLKRLVASGNQFSVLDFNPDKVPSLTDVFFGSQKCNYVSIQILQKCPTRPLKLKVSDEGRQHLMIPPPDVLERVEDLETYVQTTEINLDQFNTKDPKGQLECMLWLIENKKVEYDWLNLAGEATFCRSVGIPELESVLNKLTTLEKLDLFDCQLDPAPKINGLHNLKVLNLAKNGICSFDNVVNQTAERIDIDSNPVPGFNIETDALQSLRYLRLWSLVTKYLSLSMMERVENGSLEVDID